MEIRPTCTKT